MKRILYFAAIMGLIICVLGSCKQEEPKVCTAEELIGRWEGTNTTPGNHFVFEAETAEGDYRWGKQWDENEGMTEEDVNQDYHKSGWFQWQLITDDSGKKAKQRLRMRHMTSMGTAEAAIDQEVYVFTEEALEINDAGKHIYLVRE